MTAFYSSVKGEWHILALVEPGETLEPGDGVSRSVVVSVLIGRTWKHLPPVGDATGPTVNTSTTTQET